jgi:hypothetical protein
MVRPGGGRAGEAAAAAAAAAAEEATVSAVSGSVSLVEAVLLLALLFVVSPKLPNPKSKLSSVSPASHRPMFKTGALGLGASVTFFSTGGGAVVVSGTTAVLPHPVVGTGGGGGVGSRGGGGTTMDITGSGGVGSAVGGVGTTMDSTVATAVVGGSGADFFPPLVATTGFTMGGGLGFSACIKCADPLVAQTLPVAVVVGTLVGVGVVVGRTGGGVGSTGTAGKLP